MRFMKIKSKNDIYLYICFRIRFSLIKAFLSKLVCCSFKKLCTFFKIDGREQKVSVFAIQNIFYKTNSSYHFLLHWFLKLKPLARGLIILLVSEIYLLNLI